MNLLIDTHAILWFITEDQSLPPQTRKLIKDKTNKCFVSIASLWEIGIKYSLNRLELKGNLEQVFEIIEESGFDWLPISVKHILHISKLPYFHQDPFDRILISQAITENMAIVSKDGWFNSYDVELICK